MSDGMEAQASGAEQITQALTQLSEAAEQTVGLGFQGTTLPERHHRFRTIGLKTVVPHILKQVRHVDPGFRSSTTDGHS